MITVTWCRNLLLRGLSVSVHGPDGDEHYRCKVELKPWYFRRKQGSKHFIVDGTTVDVVWDLKAAKFNGETEPRSDYYVAIVCEDEVVLLLGDQKKDAYRKTGCRPSLSDPILISRREHIFGKRKFTRVKFSDKGTVQDISVECNSDGIDPVLEIRVDGKLAVHVKHLQWKFRGNESINVGKNGLQVFWDDHDWLFGSGPRHGLFIPSSPPSNQEPDSASGDFDNTILGSSRFCLFLYAWKVE
ncbi:putative GDSL-like Lipase/Acylhydrolase superfamily protein [Hibiscus syriacus]|uniref:GDSL-like Lipase/Acylhydrolase superfamily protein n=1 Tax=Hibiscus syriacus TaxID=106335 RepID=A0A6A3CMX3_HIBSY|nr:putative GDSL-like Lipase/Acylhydrolase superfamily protein [Hibiscus syriacus]